MIVSFFSFTCHRSDLVKAPPEHRNNVFKINRHDFRFQLQSWLRRRRVAVFMKFLISLINDLNDLFTEYSLVESLYLTIKSS